MIKNFPVILIAIAAFSCQKTQPCIDTKSTGYGKPCPNGLAQVCGCDDITYTNACYAESNGVTAWIEGPCP